MSQILAQNTCVNVTHFVNCVISTHWYVLKLHVLLHVYDFLLHVYDFSGSKVDGNKLVIMNEKLEEVLQEKQIITG